MFCFLLRVAVSPDADGTIMDVSGTKAPCQGQRRDIFVERKEKKLHAGGKGA